MNIGRFALTGLLAGSLATAAQAQLEVFASLNKNKALQFEPVLMTISISNYTSEAITLDPGTGSRLYMVARDADSHEVRTMPGAPALPRVMLPAQGGVTVTSNVSRLRDLRRKDNYTLRAVVEHGALSFQSANQFLDVVEGFPITSLHAQLSDGGARVFMLKALNRKNAERLLLQVDDPNRELCYGVYDLGNVVRSEQPQMRLDGRGSVHILFRSAPAEHRYFVYRADGTLRDQQTLTGEYRDFSLAKAENGEVTVSGSGLVGLDDLRPLEPTPIRR